MNSSRPSATPAVDPARPVVVGTVAGVAPSMTGAVAATLMKHLAGPAGMNRRQRRRLLNLESAVRRSLVGAKGIR